jgi:hemoglobin/transferrin/lactoferrin receptor protein
MTVIFNIRFVKLVRNVATVVQERGRNARLTTILLLNGLIVNAQIDSSIKKLDEVLVTAQRNSQQDINISCLVESVIAREINMYSLRTTSEALMMTNGIFVQKTNHGGGSPFVRGLTGNQTLVLVDGIRLNNSTFRYGPNQYLNTIDVFSVAKIEVAKGTGAVQYGSDALGGVIQVFTKQPGWSEKKYWKGRVLTRYMTGDMEKTTRGEVEYGSKKAAIAAGITYRDFGDLLGGDTTGKQSPSGYREWAFDVKAMWKLGSNVKLTVAQQRVQQFQVPVYHKLRLENFKTNESDPQQRLLTYARLSIDTKNNLFKEIVFTQSWHQAREGRKTLKNNASLLRKETDEINTMGFTVEIISKVRKNWLANSGIELYSDKVNSNREDINIVSNASSFSRGLYPNNSRYGNYAVYSLHQVSLSKWQLDAGARWNLLRIRIEDAAFGRVLIKPAALVGNLAASYRLSRINALFVSYSTGYRAPNIDDLGTLGVVDFRYEVPTANLSPERSRNLEIGYKLNHRKFSMKAGLFYMHLDNIITRVKKEGELINGYPVYRKENTESSFIRGTEASFDWQLTQRWNVAGGLAYQYGQNLTKKEPMRRIPPVNGRLLSCYSMKNWRFALEYSFAGKQTRLAQGDKDDSRISPNGTPAWNIVNWHAGYSYKKWRLTVGGQNLFNKDYRLHGSGINGVGRSASFTLEYYF